MKDIETEQNEKESKKLEKGQKLELLMSCDPFSLIEKILKRNSASSSFLPDGLSLCLKHIRLGP